MVNSYEGLMGTAMDPEDHDATDVPTATKHYAGDVLPMPGDRSMGSGNTSTAVDYATGKASDPKVLPIGDKALRSWVKSKTK